MNVYLTIVRYPRWLSWAGFLSMGWFRLPLLFNKNFSFYKLLGCGKNGTFDKVPDLQQWGIMAASSYNLAPTKENLQQLYGRFITGWWRFFRCEQWTVVLEPTEGHGLWDGKEVFGKLPKNLPADGPVAVLTRATIYMSKLKYFWEHVQPVAEKMKDAQGFITSLGIGEAPWVRQATFSVWQSREAMKAFAYTMHEHKDVIRKTRQQKWYSEDMFVRFRIVGSSGSIRGANPLADIS